MTLNHLPKPKMFLYYIILSLFGTNMVLAIDTDVVVLRAVRGQDARLPCGQGRVFLDGPESYILWLKNDKDFLYRYPNDESEKRSVNHDNFFVPSCDGGVCPEDTSLLLKHISDQDGGIYRCRVHYQASPAIDYVIEVRLVDSPGTPKIYNEEGEEIKNAYVGPLNIGADLTLICEVNDEQPDTLVYWRRNGVVIERAHTARPGVLRAEVHAKNITRSELDAHYECLAQNADVTEPLSASLLVKMYLPPTRVEIRLNNNYDFEAGQPRVVDCVVVGCVPPPSITWHLGESVLRPSTHKELHDGNFTVSSLTVAPSLKDNKHDLVCRAHNSHLEEVFEDKVTLNVGYRPICLTTREETVGIMPREAETVTCVVDASPEPLQFSWTFSDSRTLYTTIRKIPGNHNRYSSTLTWLPRDGDIGLLLCRATNAFGEQKRPCSYTISPGGPPNTPECDVLKAFPNTLRVQCKKGWDGGRAQTVHLELLSEDGTLLQNVSDPAGHFQLPNMEDDQNVTAVVYASNIRGRSDVKTMPLNSYKPLNSSAIYDDEEGQSDWSVMWQAIAGAASISAALVVMSFCYKTIKERRDRRLPSPDLVPRADGLFHREPDFARDDRVLGTTNITVNQLSSCQNQNPATPLPSCRVLVGCSHAAPQEPYPTAQRSFYV
ncbi:hemicentin-1-like [Galleria mellonella]|uniref:Hemicentin-1-like n=1 Tax=Galleria mellonella TaxID=7137 RepID=A0A6J1X7N0_GALME|nr:hemicentin-1-like [Galleria mellonella]